MKGLNLNSVRNKKNKTIKSERLLPKYLEKLEPTKKQQ